MSFRIRVFVLVFAVLGLLLSLVGWWARAQLVRELSLAHRERVQAEQTLAEETMRAIELDLDQRIGAVASHLEGDSAFRLAILGRNSAERRSLVDYAGQLWSLTGLQYLEVLSPEGEVLSSAHFRESHGSKRRNAHYLLSGDVLQAVVPRADGGSELIWASGARVRIGGLDYLVWGGTRDGGELGPELGSQPPNSGPEYELSWSRIDLATGKPERVRRSIVVSDDALVRARASLDRTLVAALAASLLAALFLSWVVARWIERPVRELIDKTLQVRVGREGVQFDTGRSDELGELGGFIESMVRRLRESGETLREAERRATLGDIARQVHHDVKNGVVPLRGVMRHLEEVAERDPEELRRVFRERAGTLESGLEYLEGLSTQYAKLTRRAPLEPVEVRELLMDLSRTWELAHPEVRIDLSIEEGLPPVQSESLGLRRVLENLATNAIDSMARQFSDSRGGVRAPRLGLGAVQVVKRDRTWVEIAVSDEGPGMDADDLARVFEPFYTTKESGTGLGLAIVRRLVTDYGGRVDVESTPGEGTTFRVLLPAWAG